MGRKTLGSFGRSVQVLAVLPGCFRGLVKPFASSKFTFEPLACGAVEPADKPTVQAPPTCGKH